VKEKADSDPSIKVAIHMPASLYQRLREHADRRGASISLLCREAALRELADAERAAVTP
jgi:predicted DNA-binding protein